MIYRVANEFGVESDIPRTAKGLLTFASFSVCAGREGCHGLLINSAPGAKDHLQGIRIDGLRRYLYKSMKISAMVARVLFPRLVACGIQMISQCTIALLRLHSPEAETSDTFSADQN